MDEAEEDDEEDVEEVPERQEGLHVSEDLPPQLVRVHEDDRHDERDQEPRLLVRKDGQETEGRHEAEHGHGVHVDDARLVPPVVGHDLREVVDDRKQCRDACLNDSA